MQLQHYSPLLARPDLDDEEDEILDDEDFEDEADGDGEDDEDDEKDDDSEEPWLVQAGLTSSDEVPTLAPF